ncbi:MAG: cytochrome c3 family protein [Verrucomicrobiota bacterium]
MADLKGRIRGRDIQFLLFVLAVIGVLVVLSLTGKERFIARTPAHLGVVAIEDNDRADAVCLSCHGPAPSAAGAAAKAPPMPENHPLRKKNCRQCHRLERKKS